MILLIANMSLQLQMRFINLTHQ